jgi:hypothetical protein
MSTQQAPPAAPQRPYTQHNAFAEAVRAIVRPIVTVTFAFTIVAVVLEGIDAPAWFLGLALPCITWWFGERALLRRSEAHRKEPI